MMQKVADVRANLNENIVHAARSIGRSEARRKVFEAIYAGRKQVKTAAEVADATDLSIVRVLQEANRLAADHIIEKTRVGKRLAYRKDPTFQRHKSKILALVEHPNKAAKYPTKQEPRATAIEYRIKLAGGAKPRVKRLTIDDIDSFKLVRGIQGPNELRLDRVREQSIKEALKAIIGETHDFRDWGGEKNDLFSNKLKYRGRRYSAAFALKGRATTGPLTPKKMGKNGDQIARLFASSAQFFFVVYHGKVDESIFSQMEAFALARSLSGAATYYCVVDGDDLKRIYEAYSDHFE
ncbi:MAG: hypothetical protein IH936_09850 [Acidobacteria bacterium]|nr:hypothetical protein [Acidobacteriota bacterium]